MKHRTFRGKVVDMESIRRQHEKTIASGNMGVNARGDKLGRSGEVVETAQTRARKHYKSTSSTQTKINVKGEQNAEKIFEEEKGKTSSKKSKNEPKTSSKSATTNRKKVERETESGDIILEETSNIHEDD